MVTKWALKFRGRVWETYTVSSATRESAQKLMTDHLVKVKRDDPEYADDYTVTEIPS